MKRVFPLLLVLFACSTIGYTQSTPAQMVDVSKGWKMKVADDPAFADPAFNDRDWKDIGVETFWENQGYDNLDGVAWYRLTFTMPTSMEACNKHLNGILFSLGKIDDNDVTYLNGTKIGSTDGYNLDRQYLAPKNIIRWGTINVLAIRVQDTGGGGGMYGDDHTVGSCPKNLSSFVGLSVNETKPEPFTDTKTTISRTLTIHTGKAFSALPARLHIKVYKADSHEVVLDKTTNLTLDANKDTSIKVSVKIPQQGFYKASYALYSPYLRDTITAASLLVYQQGDHSKPGEVQPVISNIIPSQSVAFDLNDVQLKGYLGDRVDANMVERLLKIDETGILECFYNRPGKQTWVGEYAGKYLHAAARAWDYSRDTRLKTQMDRIADVLISCQNDDGYLGTYLPANYWTDWDIWAHKYDLLGLLSYYRVTNYQPAIKICERIGDLICRTFGTGPGQIRLEETGGHVGMASTSILEPMVELYRYTGDKKYLDFCNYIISAYDGPKGPKIIQTLNTIGKVNKTANAKAYEMMSNCTGIVKLYQVTGNPALLSAMRNGWNDIAANRLYITGTSSKGELFQDDGVFPADNPVHMGEGCVSTTWLQFTQAMYNLTGQAKYIDEIEKTIYNHLFAAENPNTGCVAYYTALQGAKPYRCTIMGHCCLASVPRAIAAIPELVFTKNSLGGYNINLYTTGSFQQQTMVNGKPVPVKFNIVSGFPAKGNATIIINTPQPQKFQLSLRVPVWATNFEATIHGKKYKGIPGQYLVVGRQWSKQSTITISMNLDVHSLDGGQSYPGQIAIKTGAQVLALDNDLNPFIKNMDDVSVMNATINPLPAGSLPANWFGKQVYGAKAIYQGKPVTVKLVPFAEAGQNGGEVRVWIKKQ